MFLKKLFKSSDWNREKWVFIALLVGLMMTGGIHFLAQRSIYENSQFEAQLQDALRLKTNLHKTERHIRNLENILEILVISNDPAILDRYNKEIHLIQTELSNIGAVNKSDQEEGSTSLMILKESIHHIIESSTTFVSTLDNVGASFDKEFYNLITQKFRRSYDLFYNLQYSDESVKFEIMLEQRSKTLFIDNVAYVFGIGLIIISLVFLLSSFQKRMKLEENLILANEEITRAASIKEQFLANMSHEIRTPLQGIIGFTNRLTKEKLTNQQSEYVKFVEIASENLLRLVNDILDASKIESGMMRIEETPFSLPGLLHSLDSMFQPIVAEKDIYFKIHPDKRLPEILIGDPFRLTQVLINLINNAIKFTDKGGIDIFLNVISRTEQNINLQISIRDSGVGIPESKLHKIFSRFEQADSKVTRLYGGSGLGLYIVKEMIRLQNGKISVQSTLGQGSEFTIELPYILGHKIQKDFKRNRKLIDINHNFEDLSVLVVEDNLMNQRLIGMFLSDNKMNFDMAENGKLAIQLLENKKYDVILMDIQMPEMDGYSTTEYLRENLKISTPIIAMTAHAMAGEREKALTAGMNDYISKPLRDHDLLNIIGRFVPLNRKKQTKYKNLKDEVFNVNETITGHIDLSIDYNYLITSSRGKREYLKNILELFVTEAPEEVRSINKAFDLGNYVQVSQIAHSLKSTVGIVGMEESFQPILEAIEKEAADGNDPKALNFLLNQLSELIEQALIKVNTEVLPIVSKS